MKGKMSALYFLMIFSSFANTLKLPLFLCGSIPFQHVKESQMSKPIPAQAINEFQSSEGTQDSEAG